MKPVLFISDLHLEDAAPARSEWFDAFLRGPASGASDLYILGDLFEYWIGDDALSTTAQHVAERLRALRTQGVRCCFTHGNRDFLVGARYAEMAGMELLAEETVIDLFGTPNLLLHGDSLCTDDTAYQALRRQFRDPEWQASVLALTVQERLKLAQSARAESMLHTSSASMEIMDVNAEAVRQAFQRHGVTRMIHGHTHRPDRHQIDLDGVAAERLVLADWYDYGSYLAVTPDGAESVRLPA